MGSEPEFDDMSYLQKRANSGTRADWSAVAKLRKGDRVLFYLTDPHGGFVASGIADSDARSTNGEDRFPYRCFVKPVTMFDRIILRAEAQALLPQLPWINAKGRFGRTTVADGFKEMVWRKLLQAAANQAGGFSDTDQALNRTEQEVLAKFRLSQGSFRKGLVRVWGGKCSVSGCDHAEILEAAHIKPWSESSDEERQSLKNGLLLTPNLHSLLDKFLISFDKNGRILIAARLPKSEWDSLGITLEMWLRKPSEPGAEFLACHRKKFLRLNRREND